jgi:DNA-binding NtrC family response regulator
MIIPKNVESAVLVVSSSPQRGMALSNMLDGVRIAAMHSRDCRGAVAHLSRSAISVVICDTDLPDGDWKDVLQQVLQARSAPVLIVSRVADHSLWAEVLNLGGYDVLAQPFDREEVTRVIASALRASSAALWCRPA